MKLSIIVPVYNEQATLAEIVRRVQAVELDGLEREIIIVNDGSSDDSAAVMASLQAAHPQQIKTCHMPVNLGKGSAVRIGLCLAEGDIILIQDADLELDPASYPQLVAPLLAGQAEVVYGSRFLAGRSPSPGWTRLANLGLALLTGLLYWTWLTDVETGYKVFLRRALDGITLRCANFDIDPELTAKLLKARRRVVEVPVTYRPRTVLEGKKICLRDAFDAVYTLLKYRVFD